MLHDPRRFVLGRREALGDTEPAECDHAFGQGNLETPSARQFELRLCGVARQLDCDLILGVARDLTGKLFDLVLERCA
jgi:hypothetical protein